MRVSNFTVYTAGDMAGSLTSAAVSLYQIYGWSAQFVFTGSPVGTLKVQVSDDRYLNEYNAVQTPTNWTDLVDSSTAIAAAGDITYNVDTAYYNWIRFVYTRSSGSGTLDGRVNLKGQ